MTAAVASALHMLGLYMDNPMFHAKLGLLVLAGVLELWPMVTLIRWRIQQARGQEPSTERMGAFRILNRVQTFLLVALVCCASLIARGIGM